MPKSALSHDTHDHTLAAATASDKPIQDAALALIAIWLKTDPSTQDVIAFLDAVLSSVSR